MSITGAMPQSEYLSRLLSERPTVIARNKVRDQSEQVIITQARASTQKIPTIVQTTDGATSTVMYKSSVGNGSQGTYTGVLQAAQHCAICQDPTDPAVNAFIILPSTVVDHNAPPYSQQNLSTLYTNCSVPPKQVFFPGKLSATCSTNQILYPFPS